MLKEIEIEEEEVKKKIGSNQANESNKMKKRIN